MADEDRSPVAEASPDNTPAEAEGPAVEPPVATAAPEPAEEAHESQTKGMLRDAINKVIEEIQYHEREAQRHLHLARELRKDLRESFAFVMEQKGKREVIRDAAEERPEAVPAPGAIPAPTPHAATERRPRMKRRKKRAGRRAKRE
jgi:hypothetical protein